jgi:drug/metabolite transporter (DMT)-like permease
MNPVFYAIISILLVASSQFLFKKGVEDHQKNISKSRPGWRYWLLIFFQKPILLGLGLNALAAFFWLLALSVLELSYIFPFLALNYLIIPLGAFLLYKEKISLYRLLGIAIICVGVLVIAFS